MQDLYLNIEIKANEIYSTYIDQGLEHKYPFMGVGLQFTQFAMDEPELYRLLFMTKQGEQIDSIQAFLMNDENYQLILDALKQSYQIADEEAKWLYKHSFVYVYGLATLYITGLVSFHIEDVYHMLNEMFTRWVRGVEDRRV